MYIKFVHILNLEFAKKSYLEFAKTLFLKLAERLSPVRKNVVSVQVIVLSVHVYIPAILGQIHNFDNFKLVRNVNNTLEEAKFLHWNHE